MKDRFCSLLSLQIGLLGLTAQSEMSPPQAASALPPVHFPHQSPVGLQLPLLPALSIDDCDCRSRYSLATSSHRPSLKPALRARLAEPTR